MTISPELQRIYASAPQDDKYIETLELAHPLFSKSFFFTNDLSTWRFMLEDGVTEQDFEIVPFQIILPTQDAGGQQDLRIGIDNVGREAVEEIEAAQEDPTKPISVTYRVYLDQPLSVPQMDPPLKLTLTDVQVSLSSITGVATRADTLNRLFPNIVYRSETFPGLDR